MRSAIVALCLLLATACGATGAASPAAPTTDPTPTPSRSAPATPTERPRTAVELMGVGSTPVVSRLPRATSVVPDRFLISPGRVGAVRAGMSGEELQARGSARLDRECEPYWQLKNPDLSGIFYADPGRDPHGQTLDGLGVANAPYSTAAGIHRGSTFGELRAAYGSRLFVPLGTARNFPGLYPPVVLTTDEGSVAFAFSVGPRWGPPDDAPITQIIASRPVTRFSLVLLGYDVYDPC